MSAVFGPLAEQGLSLQAVWDIDTLPADVLQGLCLSAAERASWRQLVLIGHHGRAFWEALQRRGMHGSDPVDTFVAECVRRWMAASLPGHRWWLVFPGERPVGLQRLGELAGWHQPSPFRVGVDAEWGSWFAYRAVLLTDTALPVTPRRQQSSPCLSCSAQPCVAACPAGALVAGRPEVAAAGFGLRACIDHRLRPASPCQDRCLARLACPVGEQARYSEAQIAYHYLQSLPAIRRWREALDPQVA